MNAPKGAATKDVSGGGALAEIEATYERESTPDLEAFQRGEIDFGTWKSRHNAHVAKYDSARHAALSEQQS